MSEKPDFSRIGVVLFLFILSYVIIYFLSITRNAVAAATAGIPLLNLLLPIPALDSPMLLLFPVAGFFLLYMLADWLESYFEVNVRNVKFFLLVLVIFILLAGLAFSAAVFFYYNNLAQLQSNGVKVTLFLCYVDEPGCSEAVAQLNAPENQQTTVDGKPIQFSLINFWSELKKSAFYPFVIAAILGLIAAFVERRALRNLVGQQEPT